MHCNGKGTVHQVTKEGSFNREDFEAFLLEIRELLSIENLDDFVIVMDNASIHHNLNVPEGLFLKYLPPYSPFLNPIESVFSVVKAKLKQCLPEINVGISQPESKKKLLEIVWKTVFQAQNFANFYRHCSSFLTRCLLKDDILGD